MISYKHILSSINKTRRLEFNKQLNSQQICAELLKNESGTVLDYGCGPMDIKNWLPDSIKYVPYDPDINRKDVIHNLPKDKFDWIVCHQVVEHLNIKEIEEFLNYCVTHTNKVMISTMNINHLNWYDFHTQITHITPLYWKHFASFVEGFGFKVEQIIFAMPFRNPLKVLLCKLFGSIPYNEYLIVIKK